MANPRPDDRSGDASDPAPGGSGAFEDLVQFSPDAIVVVDASGTIRHASPSVRTVLGHRPEDLDGTRFETLVDSGATAEVRTFLHNITTRSDGTAASAELRLRRADGSTMDGEATGVSLLANLDARGIVITIRDISHRKSLEDQLRFQAFHDALTGLANRALFSDRLERAIRVRRGPGEIAPAVAFLDLDDFKTINDTYGHAIGDRVLQVVAERIMTTLRSADTAARLGGDEFAILIEDPIQPAHLVELVQRVVDAINRPIIVSERSITVGASAGVAAASADVVHGQELVRRADVAMYRAKAQGKARVVVFDTGVSAAVDDHVTQTAALDAAITDHAVRASYVPVVDLGSGLIVSADTRIEWERADGRCVGLDSFVDLAIDTGLLIPLYGEILSQTIEALGVWSDVSGRIEPDDDSSGRPGGRLSPVSVTVALPAEVVADAGFGTRLAGRCAMASVDTRRIVFNVGESILRDESVVATLRGWARLGFGLSVDHFGTEQTSRRLLERVPLRCLRIDESYVAYLREHRDQTLLAGLVDLADAIGADTMAGGVDSFAAAEQLWSLGCVTASGSAFGGPASLDGFARLLAEEPDRAWTGFVR